MHELSILGQEASLKILSDSTGEGVHCVKNMNFHSTSPLLSRKKQILW